jgi:hypothetical protein
MPTRRRRLGWRGAGALLAIGIGVTSAIVAYAGSPAAEGAGPGASSRLWVLAASHFAEVVGAPGVLPKFRGTTVYEVISLRERPSTLVPVVPTLDFHSYALMAATLAHPIPSYIRAVIYDNERYPNTPAVEQANPVKYTNLAIALAHAHHLRILCDYIEPDRTLGGYVPACDVVGLNTVQQSERNPALYRAKVARLVEIIHRARPGVPVIAGLSSNPAGPPVTATALTKALTAVSSLVAGFWLNVPAPGVGCPACGKPAPGILAAALAAWHAPPVASAFPRPPLPGGSGGLSWVMAGSAWTMLPSRTADWLRQEPATVVLVPGRGAPTATGAPTVWLDIRAATAIPTERPPGAGSTLRAVLLDLERWSFTPAAEQAAPVAATRAADARAHRIGLSLIAAPALDLFSGSHPALEALREDFYGRIARVADGVEIQAQGLELHPKAYQAFVTAVVRQVHAAHPAIPVWAGLSTNPAVGRPSLQDLLADVNGVRDLVRGFWLNVPTPGPACPRCLPADPALAVALLTEVGGR